MTVENKTGRWEDLGTGSLTAFDHDNLIPTAADLEVYVDGVLKTLTVDYSITGLGVKEGGQVIFVVAPPLNAEVVRVRVVADEQNYDVTVSPLLKPESLEAALDRRTMVSQQTTDKLNRTIRFPIAEANAPSPELPVKAVRASRFLGFDPAGAFATFQGVGLSRGDWAAATAYNVNDFVTDGAAGADTKNIYAALSDHTSGVWATDLAAGKWRLAIAVADITGPQGDQGDVGPAGSVSVIDRDVTAATVTGTTAETTVYSFLVPAGSLGTNKMLRLSLIFDQVSPASAPQTLTVRIKYGATTIHQVTAQVFSPSATRFARTQVIDLVAANSATAQVSVLRFDHGSGSSGAVLNNAIAENSAADQTLSVTFQSNFSSAEAVLYSAQLELL